MSSRPRRGEAKITRSEASPRQTLVGRACGGWVRCGSIWFGLAKALFVLPRRLYNMLCLSVCVCVVRVCCIWACALHFRMQTYVSLRCPALELSRGSWGGPRLQRNDPLCFICNCHHNPVFANWYELIWCAPLRLAAAERCLVPASCFLTSFQYVIEYTPTHPTRTTTEHAWQWSNTIDRAIERSSSRTTERLSNDATTQPHHRAINASSNQSIRRFNAM